MSIKETREGEPLLKCRKRRDDVKTEVKSLTQDKSKGKPVYCLDGIRHEGGVNLIRALL